MDYCFLAKDGSDASLTVLSGQGLRLQGHPGAPRVAQRSVARRHGGPSGVEHPSARTPPEGPAQD
eukprot:9177655-Alexandrium_andersonii.AAC.1